MGSFAYAATRNHPSVYDEELHTNQFREQICYSSRMSDEEFDALSRLDGGVRVQARAPCEMDYRTEYFDDEDLHHRLGDDYDYPQGVDEEDDEDLYAEDALDDWMLFRNDDLPELGKTGGLGEREDRDAQIIVRYFDANDLCGGDAHISVYEEEELETGVQEQEFQNVLEDDILGWKVLSRDNLSTLRKEYNKWRSGHLARPFQADGK